MKAVPACFEGALYWGSLTDPGGCCKSFNPVVRAFFRVWSPALLYPDSSQILYRNTVYYSGNFVSMPVYTGVIRESLSVVQVQLSYTVPKKIKVE